MAELRVLRHAEGVCLNPDRLVLLYSELGETGAERVMLRTMENIDARLDDIDRLSRSGQVAALIRSARTLSKMADQIGMETLSRVALDVVAASETGDDAARAAIVARLMRIADRSVRAVWDLKDMTV